MPGFGDLFTDLRGDDRTMRVSYHPDRGAVVVSLWTGTLCRGSFRMPVDDVPTLLSLLSEIAASVGTAGTPSPAPAPPDSGAGTAAAGQAAATAPPMDQTGTISDTAHRRALPIRPVPRVA